jgi:chromosome segregation ATPase
LLISLGSFGGFQWKNGHLRLGWITFSTIPFDAEEQLKRAGEEITSLQAQMARAATEAEAKLDLARKENEGLEAQMSRLSVEHERLQALVERVSSGLR